MPFISGFELPKKTEKTALWFLVRDQKLLLRKIDEVYELPRTTDIEEFGIVPEEIFFLGSLDGNQCYASELSEDIGVAPHILSLRTIISLIGRIDDKLAYVAGLANQIVHWDRTHKYCGRCGNIVVDKADERAKYCSNCGLINYPRLSPAIIVAIIRDKEILLAHSQRFPVKFYSVLAGFVEPGETLEDCVEREILEEVGIEVKNIKYFGSQPWPFPDSLMIAFTCQYAGGEIDVDDSEITHAGWFSVDNLPPVPSKYSIAGKLIDWFISKRA